LINFASVAINEGSDLNPSNVNVNQLKFQDGGTDFCKALDEVLNFVRLDN
jgi:hypothetical protein